MKLKKRKSWCVQCVSMPAKVSKKVVGMIIRSRKSIMKDGVITSSGIGEASVYHALVVIFLEFFAWGLLTMPIIAVLNKTFPDHTFLMNGLIMGIKGILSFLSAPLIGALSDVWGRKFFLLITVAFTCAPIPLMSINTWWFFAMISISGVFACTFSVVFAYVADVTEESERSLAYGLVSATFAASMVISPALGSYLMEVYEQNFPVALATAIAILDVFFILVAVPESLPEKARPPAPISWEQADPFAALGKVGKDHTILMLCVTVFLSYLPEAGQYSCIFVYLKLVMGFSATMVAVFIAVVGILSVCAQIILGPLMKTLGSKHTIMLGLLFEMLQLMWYGFGSQTWMMWAAGGLASVSSITYPAISAFVSMHSDADKQGLVQGMVTGMRGLCNGLGPAMFGVIFYLFHVDLNDDSSSSPRNTPKPPSPGDANGTSSNTHFEVIPQFIPGPPFVFGAFLVICALLVAAFIPDSGSTMLGSAHPSGSRRPSDYSKVNIPLYPTSIYRDDESLKMLLNSSQSLRCPTQLCSKRNVSSRCSVSY
ncbi:hippocampus abundant transcript 1 protein isoform X2 [Neodiprion pinetum]|uniref:Hippocampus abundant transcript 1 protein isoform X2 n=1 Tax=Neodiprion lecontei TaxID=441921 RepID=A0ABM3G2X8_NEOLC|nr:hippocampus abundant transcript 1 protein isoform X2 [Neodiprion fabricii]XP_046475587.1 hippocampus abundant transcript 1 protein isoform X2 [Neodiprion pinetum]XP_046594624.1 hippocampus abundant transcript 1 protein isoform X2 [Neodiprion lecontei]XP_046617273.1 hippocampus abundant transcript 1 protein isoform X2 [Neodiprion virginianus]